MVAARKTSLARSLGRFLGHITRAVKSDPARDREARTLRTTVEEEDRGDVVLRRTTIEEIEMKKASDQATE